MPLPINGHHQEETVTPDNADVMGRENVQENMARPSIVRQRSRVEPVEDDSDESTKSLKLQKSNGQSDNGARNVHFSKTQETFSKHKGACGNDEGEGIEFRPQENDEEAYLCVSDNKNEKHTRQRQEKKKRVRKQWLTICTCGLVIFLIAAAALGFAVYNYEKTNQLSQSNSKQNVMYCYPCNLVKAEDIITYDENYSMCCVGKDVEIRSNAEPKASPYVVEVKEEKEKPKKVHKVKFREIGVDVSRSEGEKLGFKLSPSEDVDQFLHLIEPGYTGIMIEETGLYMLTLTLSTKAPSGDAYYRFLACLKFQKGTFQDDECRKVTLLPKSGDPFDIHKIQNIEKGTIVRATVTHKNLLDSNVIFNKLIVTQLHKD